MAYRDEREALHNQVEKLEVDLDEARRHAAGDDALRARADQMSAEIATLRQNADRLEAELRQLRPAPAPAPGAGPARPVVALALGGVALIGLFGAAAGAFVFLRSAGTGPAEPPDVAVAPVPTAQVVEVPTATPPTAVAPGAPKEAPKPSGGGAHQGKARWVATVKQAQGLPIKAGSSCSIDTTFHAIGTNEEWPDVVVTCGAQTIYDSSDSLSGMAMTSADPVEHFGPGGDTSVFTLKYEDKGTRGSSKNQIMLDTTKRLAAVWSENLPAFRVELTMPIESQPGPPIAERLSGAGAIVEATGNAPAKPGAPCTMRALPDGHHEACIAEVACGGRPIVKATDAVSCTYEDDRPISIAREADGLSVTVDGQEAKLTVPGDKGFTMKLALEAPR